jgi:gas vesicle protein
VSEKGSNEMVSFLAGFIVGGLVGAATALILAPQSGARTRTHIRWKGVELRDRAQALAGDARRRAEQMAWEARRRADELAAEARRRASEMALHPEKEAAALPGDETKPPR